MNINLIVCIDKFGGIGKNGKMPWYMPSDLRRFKQLTTGRHCLVGRKTFESLPKMEDRKFIVISKSVHFKKDTKNIPVAIAPNVMQGIEFAINNFEDELFIIGGAQIYHASIPYISRFYVTFLQNNYECDAKINMAILQNYKNADKCIAVKNMKLDFNDVCESAFASWPA